MKDAAAIATLQRNAFRLVEQGPARGDLGSVLSRRRLT
jgi:hypothetical protein